MAEKPTEDDKNAALAVRLGEAERTAARWAALLQEQHKIATELTARLQAHEKAAAERWAQSETQQKTALEVVERLATAPANVQAIESLRARADGAIKEIEEATRKANSESGFAFNAKGNAEEHAKAIAQIRGTVDATFAGLTATKANIEEVATTVAALRATADGDVKAVAEAKAAVTRDAATVTAAAERVAAVMPAIDQGSKDANAITAAKDGAEASATAIQVLQTQMNEVSAKAASDGLAIAKSQGEAATAVTSMNKAATAAQAANARVNEYEGQLSKLGEEFATMQAKLEGLLPHATSAGLASAFHNQKARFSKPQPYWLGLFVAAIGALLWAAGAGLPAANDSWDAILRHFVNRLPLVAPLVWLAIYAGHHYSMALRMEEDYAFKEAVSTAFEGYKREMLAIPAGGANDVSPLVTLCENVLSALAERPGRIYDGKPDLVTPLTPAANALKEVVAELVKRRDAKP